MQKSMLIERLDALENKFRDIEVEMAAPGAWDNRERYGKLTQEHSELQKIVEVYQNYKDATQSIEENQLLLEEEDDAELRELAKEEITELKETIGDLEQQLQFLLLPKDPNDKRDVILEIRAGTGGDEAALFCSELFRMYVRYSEKMSWKVDILSSSPTGLGGYKEVIAQVTGKDVYSRLKFESGVHRVQRVPATETQGRVHTSAVTVAVLPEAEEVDVKIDNNDLKIDVYRSSGPGGQSVNTTDSAVRITHLPTGLVVICQDEKSQHKNKAKALKVLRSRLYEQELARVQAAESALRRSQVGSGDRSEKIRTYNFPQNRVSDHRISLTVYKLDQVVGGSLEHVLDPLLTAMQAEALQAANQV